MGFLDAWAFFFLSLLLLLPVMAFVLEEESLPPPLVLPRERFIRSVAWTSSAYSTSVTDFLGRGIL